ncbi:MAG: hypothetical protein KF715_10695 [Candidatus Didemnitutus sp.]|nr:hypothetical protein [Candidatus Didemnitutus sp.]
MANKSKGFVVVAKRRPSGVPYWIVRGSVGGKQIRKEFSDRTEALSFQEQKNSELFGGAAVVQATVLTRLSADLVRQAEVVLAQLEREFPGVSLHEVVDYYRAAAPELPVQDVRRFASTFTRLKEKYADANLADVCDRFLDTYKPDANGFTLGDALDSYAADVERRRETGTLSEWQATSVRIAMQKFERHFASATRLTRITTSQLHEYLIETSRAKDGSSNYSNKTWSNRRGYLTRFFNFCVQEGWIDTNPAVAIRKYSKREHRRATPMILTPEKAREVMLDAENFADGRLVPYLVLTLFCGIRPSYRDSEITRLNPEQVDVSRGEIRLHGPKTKTKKPRVVKLQPNVTAWLQKYPLEKWPIIPRNFRKTIIAFRRRHALGYDVLRHTYASMLVGKTRSVADAALQAGNSEMVMWSNYLDLVREEDAKRFWLITPEAERNPA